MELIYAAVKPYYIETLKNHFDKVKLKYVCHCIDEQCLINLLKYQSIKRDTKTRHNINYIGLGSEVQSHKNKLKKETNNDTSRPLQKPGTLEEHRAMISNFNRINKCGRRLSKKDGVDYVKQTDSIKNPYNKN